jgi:hypothetical protein
MTRGLTTAVLRRLVRVESLLVLTVLGLTAVLVSQSLPQPPATVAGTLPFDTTAGAWTVHGSVTGHGTEGFSVEVRIQDGRGTPAPDTVAVALELTMPDMVMEPLKGTLPRVGPGLYRETYQLPMTGRWQLTVRTAGGIVKVAIPTQEARVPPRPVVWSGVVLGLAAVAIGLGLVVTGLHRLGAGTGRVAWPLVAGAALVVGGAVTLVRLLG